MTPELKYPLKVFLCHASTDKPKVRELYRYLKRRGINPWFDEEHLVGGQDWQVEIPKALATSDAIIICLTKNSVDKEGYIQKEIKFALDKALEMPEGRIFLIPVKFEECEVPFSLSRYQWVDLTIEAGYAKMMKALKFRASQLERSTVEVSKKNVEEVNLAIDKAAKEKAEHEAVEKDAQENAEKEFAEKAQLESEESARQKAAKEKGEREVIEKAKYEQKENEAREKQAREAIEKVRQVDKKPGKVVSQKEEDKPAVVKPKADSRIAYRIGGFVLLVFGIVLFSSLNNRLHSPEPIPANTQTKENFLSNTETVEPSVTSMLKPTSTSASTAIPMPLPTEITDAKGVSMALVPAGEFTMGAGTSNNPQWEVYLDNYYIDKYEVTNQRYQECVRAQQCDYPFDVKLGDITYFGNTKYDSYPIVWVTTNNAEQYCASRDARLPTSKEWEKAARGIDARSYPWGEQTDFEFRANGYGSKDGFLATAPVGSFPLGGSPYGVFDMTGNVSEFVKDGVATFFVRGGGWNGGWFDSSNLHQVYYYGSLDNDYYGSSEINSWTGFRCVRDVNQ